MYTTHTITLPRFDSSGFC